MYEVHITVPRETYPKYFLLICNKILGVRGLYLNLLNGQVDMMTSTKTSSYMNEVVRLTKVLTNFTRIKVEANPYTCKESSLYYEAHFDSYINGLPQSFNMLNGKRYSTLRMSGVTLAEFEAVVETYGQSAQIEAVIIDTNPNWDDEWVFKNSS